jgi:hypothetical protein
VARDLPLRSQPRERYQTLPPLLLCYDVRTIVLLYSACNVAVHHCLPTGHKRYDTPRASGRSAARFPASQEPLVSLGWWHLTCSRRPLPPLKLER